MKRERQTDRQTETETDRQTETETDRFRDWQTETERQREGERDRDRDIERQTDRDRDRQTEREREKRKRKEAVDSEGRRIIVAYYFVRLRKFRWIVISFKQRSDASEFVHYVPEIVSWFYLQKESGEIILGTRFCCCCCWWWWWWWWWWCFPSVLRIIVGVR